MWRIEITALLLVVWWTCLSTISGMEASKGPLRSYITGGYKGAQTRHLKSTVDCKEFSNDHDILYQFPFLIMINPINSNWEKSVAYMDDDTGLVRQLVLRQEEDAVPPSLFCLRNLRQLTIDHVPFHDGVVPDGLGNLRKLQELHIQYSTIVNMTERLGALTNLNYLTIFKCGLASLPNLSELQVLSSVQLSGNQLSKIDGLTGVQSLTLDNNRFSDIPTISSLETLQHLVMYNNPLRDMQKITTHVSLKSLYLSNTGLTSIPTTIDRLTQLEDLDLSRNKLFFVPTNMLQMAALRYFDLRFNSLSPSDKKKIEDEFRKAKSTMTLLL